MIEKEGEQMSGRIVRHVAITDIYHGPRPQDHGPRVAIPEDRAYVLCVRACTRSVLWPQKSHVEKRRTAKACQSEKKESSQATGTDTAHGITHSHSSTPRLSKV